MTFRFFYISFVFFAFFIFPAIAKDSISVYQVLQRIEKLQIKQHNDFPKGMFATYREYTRNEGVYKNDDNIFFTGLIIFTLQELKKSFTIREQQLADSIIKTARILFPAFQNAQGRNTYNFWRTNPPIVFPNGGWLNWMNKSHALPDDMDDTSIILLALNSPDSIVERVHTLMQQFANTNGRRIQNTFADYKNIPAYSTWFGERMPIDFDVCVLSNILYLVQHYNLPYTSTDSASVQLLCKMVENKHYNDEAHYISPHYARPPIILYHLSRLMAQKEIPELMKYQHQLIADTKKHFYATDNIIDKIILSTSLLRWNTEPPTITINTNENFFTFIERNDFVFFVASMSSMLPDPWKEKLGNAGIGKFAYYCPAYNNLLLLEYLVWLERRNRIKHL